MHERKFRYRLQCVVVLLGITLLDACRPTAMPAVGLPFVFPENEGNYRVSGNKRIDILFPLNSRNFATCSGGQYRRYSLTRDRVLSFTIFQRFPENARGLGANDVTASVIVRMDSATIAWDSTWTPERIRAVSYDPIFARFDSVIVPDFKTTNKLLKRAVLVVERRIGEPPTSRDIRTFQLSDARLQNGRLRFSVTDTAAIRYMLLPNNVSVGMRWCATPSTRSDKLTSSPFYQVTIERRP